MDYPVLPLDSVHWTPFCGPHTYPLVCSGKLALPSWPAVTGLRYRSLDYTLLHYARAPLITLRVRSHDPL